MSEKSDPQWWEKGLPVKLTTEQLEEIRLRNTARTPEEIEKASRQQELINRTCPPHRKPRRYGSPP